jgi:hypothetical protein
MEIRGRLAGAVLVAVLMSATAHVSGQQPDAAAAVSRFEAAIAEYLAMRERLLTETPRPTPNSTAAQLTRASDALAAAIQRARRGAKPGDLFSMPVSDVIKHDIDDTVRKQQLGPVLANIDDEEPGVAAPAVHMRFPAAAQMATMPPSLLAILPKLPSELEYRIVGTALVLRDVDAALILDYIPAAVQRGR